MAKRLVNNVRLGAFVMAGLLFLVLLLYMIGRNRSLFGSNYILKARFENVQGLVPGNNVRYSGIQSGTVKTIEIVNDTSIEVSMLIDTKMEDIIRKDAIVSIGSDGLVGNKVVNIIPGEIHDDLAKEGDVLVSKNPIDTESILKTLSKTNNDVAEIVSGLKVTVERINNSTALWSILSEESLPEDLRQSAANIRKATSRAGLMADDLHVIVSDLKSGKGSAGILLRDTSFANNLNQAVLKMRQLSTNADKLSLQMTTLVSGIQNDLNSGKGAASTILKDTSVVNKLNTSLDNIQRGTDGFNQNMEALKKSFLLRGYFKRQEKKRASSNP
jgi:phospholipid/cholesterol/gamma-HCH transport system substrate-binding protein